ncbi:MAG: hypothetical protein K2X47_01835 [Bdellovibrionales bacterium]|nr:hypothetical protein [Bdellovibrionales bacterium]
MLRIFKKAMAFVATFGLILICSTSFAGRLNVFGLGRSNKLSEAEQALVDATRHEFQQTKELIRTKAKAIKRAADLATTTAGGVCTHLAAATDVAAQGIKEGVSSVTGRSKTDGVPAEPFLEGVPPLETPSPLSKTETPHALQEDANATPEETLEELEEAKRKSQKGVDDAILQGIESLKSDLKINKNLIEAYLKSGSFVPRYAAKERLSLSRCREALKIGKTDPCESYRSIFGEVESSYYKLRYYGKRLQELFYEQTQLETLNLSASELTERTRRLESDIAAIMLIRNEAFKSFGSQYHEYRNVRAFFESRYKLLTDFISFTTKKAGPFSNTEIDAFIRQNDEKTTKDFQKFMQQQAESGVLSTLSKVEIFSAYEIGKNLGEAFPSETRRKYLLDAVKNGRKHFPQQGSQEKFDIMEVIVRVNFVYLNEEGEIRSTKAEGFTKKTLTNFPEEHIGYLKQVIAKMEIGPLFKEALNSRVSLLLHRPTLAEVDHLQKDPIYHQIFEKFESERRLRAEKETRHLLQLFQEGYFKPVFQVIDRIPDEGKKKVFKDFLVAALGLSKDLYYLWAYSGEIDAINSISEEMESPIKSQLKLLLLLNAKYNVSHRTKNSFLLAAARSIEFRDNWDAIIRYVEGLSLKEVQYQKELAQQRGGDAGPQTEESYTFLLKKLYDIREQARTEEDLSILYPPTKAQVAHAVAGAMFSLAGLIKVVPTAAKAVSIPWQLFLWFMHTMRILLDQGIIYANQHLHLSEQLPLLKQYLPF